MKNLKVTKTNLIKIPYLIDEKILITVLIDLVMTKQSSKRKMKSPKGEVYYTITESGDLITIENEELDYMESAGEVRSLLFSRLSRNLSCIRDEDFKKSVENRVKIKLGDL